MAQPRLTKLLDGIAFGESPRWHEGRLWFADWGTQEIVAVDLDGKAEAIVKVDFPSFPMCFDWLPDGRLLIEFQSIPGRNYTILYADNPQMTNALAAQPVVIAPADRVQWLDGGPPGTVSAPTNVSSRFYSVLLNP